MVIVKIYMKNLKFDKKISVIVPIYNVENYLSDCIDSIENQTYKNIEIILVDDGSTDKSLEIAKKFEEKYKNIKVISQKNNGQGSARNTGLKFSTGDYISFIDSDDLIDANMYECMISQALKYDLDIVECSYQEFCNNKKGYIYYSKAEKNKVYLGKDYYECKPTLSPCNKIYNAKFLKQVDFICTENRYAEDVYDITYLILKSKKIMRLDKCFYYYRRDNANSTRNNVNIEHKIKLGIDKLFISNKLNQLRINLNCNGYISNIIIRNIFGVIFTKMFISNSYYRNVIKHYIREFNINEIIKENINLKILISLLNTYFKKVILKKD